jgi:nucleoid DNA-binding protein
MNKHELIGAVTVSTGESKAAMGERVPIAPAKAVEFFAGEDFMNEVNA